MKKSYRNLIFLCVITLPNYAAATVAPEIYEAETALCETNCTTANNGGSVVLGGKTGNTYLQWNDVKGKEYVGSFDIKIRYQIQNTETLFNLAINDTAPVAAEGAINTEPQIVVEDDWNWIIFPNILLPDINSQAQNSIRFSAAAKDAGSSLRKLRVDRMEITKVIPYSFVNIHLEPNTTQRFEAMNVLAEQAHASHTRLTILLNPNWITVFSANGALQDKLVSWITDYGFEIGIHHHGPSHSRFGWNLHTRLGDDPQIAAQKALELRESDYSWPTLNGAAVRHWPDFWTNLNALLADYGQTVRTSTSTDKWTDYPNLSDGVTSLVEISSGYSGKGADKGKSTKAFLNKFGYAETAINSYKFPSAGAPTTCQSGEKCTLDDYLREYYKLPANAVYGFTFHGTEFGTEVCTQTSITSADNIHDSVCGWFQALHEIDPSGSKRLTVSEIFDIFSANGQIYGDDSWENRCGNSICDSIERDILQSSYCAIDCDLCEDTSNTHLSSSRTNCEKGDNVLLWELSSQ